MLSNMNRLLWIWRAGGMYDANASEDKQVRTARGRILVAAVTPTRPWCGLTGVVACNCHLHRLTANKSHGFARPHDFFWNKLASTILARRVRILAGDFNMSLWIVALELRQRGVQTTLAGACAWAEPCASEAKSEFCGMCLLAPWRAPSSSGVRASSHPSLRA